MKQNKSFVSYEQELSPKNQKGVREQQSIRYDIRYIYGRIRNQDHLVFVLQKCCDAALHYAQSRTQEFTGLGSLPGRSRFVIDEQVQSHFFQIDIETPMPAEDLSMRAPRDTSLWHLLREICHNSAFKSDEVYQVVSDHESGSRGLLARDQGRNVIPCALIAMKGKLQSLYKQIHVYRPLIHALMTNPSEQLFVDIYRNQLYHSQLCRNVVTPMRTKKRSRSCQLIPLVRSFAACSPHSDIQSISMSSEIVSVISVNNEEGCMQTLREMVALMDTCQTNNHIQDCESAVSQDGSEAAEPTEQETKDQLDKGNEISILLDYFQKPEEPVKDSASNGSSFVVVSDM